MKRRIFCPPDEGVAKGLVRHSALRQVDLAPFATASDGGRAVQQDVASIVGAVGEPCTALDQVPRQRPSVV